MNREIELANKIKEELENTDLFQEYKRIKALVDSDKELSEMRIEIKSSTQNVTKNQELLKEYNSHPLIVNYNELLNEVSRYLAEIIQIINKK